MQERRTSPGRRSILTNAVLTITQDRDGRLWFVNLRELGLAELDAAKEKDQIAQSLHDWEQARLLTVDVMENAILREVSDRIPRRRLEKDCPSKLVHAGSLHARPRWETLRHRRSLTRPPWREHGWNHARTVRSGRKPSRRNQIEGISLRASSACDSSAPKRGPGQ
jgi:hypothetical protein